MKLLIWYMYTLKVEWQNKYNQKNIHTLSKPSTKHQYFMTEFFLVIPKSKKIHWKLEPDIALR